MRKTGKVRSLHAHVRKRRKGWRRKGIEWEYNGDGRFFREQMKGADKRYWRRWNRRSEHPCG